MHDMRRIAIIIAALLGAAAAAAQNADSLAGAYLNGGDWFALRRLAGQRGDEMAPYLKVFSEAMIGSYFNRPLEASAAIDRLTGEYGGMLGTDNTVAMTLQNAMNLSKAGRNAEAAGKMKALCDSGAELTDEQRATLRAQQRLYEGLARFVLYGSEGGRREHTVPFRLDSINGPGSYMIVMDGELNGRRYDFVFDTGAAVNVVSPRVAEECGMELLDAEVSATGMNRGTGRVAIARRFRLGGIVFENVPFYVLDLGTGNEQADGVLLRLQAIVGIPLMEHFRNIHIDMNGKVMTMAERPFADSNAGWTDMCSVNGHLRLAVRQDGEELAMTMDTGSQASSFSPRYYVRHAQHIETVGTRTEIGLAGFGGAVRTEVARMPYACLEAGDRICCLCNVAVHPPGNNSGDMFNQLDGMLGLDFFLHFGHIYMNMDDMRMGVGY